MTAGSFIAFLHPSLFLAALVPSPAPSPPHWTEMVGNLAPLATFAVALVAFLTFRQKKEADERDAWWDRAVKALDLMTEDDGLAQDAGMALADRLSQSKLAKQEDQLMFQAATEALEKALTRRLEDERRLRTDAKGRRWHLLLRRPPGGFESSGGELPRQADSPTVE